jgi:hypothetical protein
MSADSRSEVARPVVVLLGLAVANVPPYGEDGTVAEVRPRKEAVMDDRHPDNVPHVRDQGGGSQPRSRNKDGSWRAKRSAAGKSRVPVGSRSTRGGKK